MFSSIKKHTLQILQHQYGFLPSLAINIQTSSLYMYTRLNSFHDSYWFVESQSIFHLLKIITMTDLL